MISEDTEKDFIIQLLTRKIEKERELRCQSEVTVDELKLEVEQYASCATRLKSKLSTRLDVAESQAANFIDKQSVEFVHVNEVVDQLKKEIAQLRHRNEVECASLKVKIESQRAEYENKIKTIEFKSVQVENERNKIADEVMNLQKKVMAASIRVTEQRHSIRQQKEKDAEITAENTRLSTELKKARFISSQAQLRAETFSKQLAEMRERLVTAEKVNSKIQEKLTQAVERRAAAVALADAAKRRADSASLKAENLDSDVRVKNDNLKASYNELQNEGARLKCRVKSLQEEASKWKDGYKSSQERIRFMEKEARDIMEKHQSLDSQLSTERQRVATYHARLAQSLESADKAKIEAEVTIETGAKERERMASELKALQDYIELQLEPQLLNINWRNANLKETHARQVAELQEEVDQYKTAIDDSERAMNDLAALSATLREKLDSGKIQQINEISRMSVITILEDKLNSSAKEIVTLKNNYKQGMQTASNEIVQLRAHISSLDGVVSQVRAELTSANATVKTVNEERNSALLVIGHMKTSQAGDIEFKDGIIQDLENNNAILERNVRLWQEKCDSTKEELERTICENAFKLSALESELATSKNSEIERKDSATSSLVDYAKMEEKLSTFEAVRQTLREEVRVATVNQNELQKSLTEADQRVVNLQLSLNERMHEIDQLKTESTERNRLLEFRVHDLNQLQKAVQMRMEQLQEELALTKRELDEKHKALNELEKKRMKSEQQLHKMEEQLSSRNEKDTELKKENKALSESNANLQNQVVGRTEDVSNLKKENKRMTERSVKLEAQLEVRTEEVSNLKAENKKLSEDHAKLDSQLHGHLGEVGKIKKENKQLVEQAIEEKKMYTEKLCEIQKTHMSAIEAFERETACRREWERILTEKEATFHASVDEFELKMTKKDKLLKQLTNKLSESRLEITRLQKSLQGVENKVEDLEQTRSALQVKLGESESCMRKAEQRASRLEIEAGAVKIVSKCCDSPGDQRMTSLSDFRRKSLSIQRSSILSAKTESVEQSSKTRVRGVNVISPRSASERPIFK